MSIVEAEPPGLTARQFGLLVLAGAVIVGAVLLSWTGFIESDDSAYAGAAIQWASHFPYLGTGHHALRHVIVLPMALLFRLFGQSEFTLELPNLLYFAGVLIVSFLAVSRVAGFAAGLLAMVLTGLTPSLTLGASVTTTDLAETFFVLTSIWSFFFAWPDNRRALFVLSGALAGFGFITRETSAAVLVLYGVLFLMNHGRNRAAYFWMAGGFVLVAGTDLVALWLASGDPLYRFHISLQGVARDGPEMEGQIQTAAGVDQFGALAAARWLKPLTIAFANQYFGVLLWFAVPAAVMLAAEGNRSRAASAGRLLAGAGLTWFLVLFYGLFPWLWVLSRYMDFTAVAFAVPLSIMLSRYWSGGRRWLVVACMAAILAIDFVAIYSSDNQIMFGEKTLVAYARDSAEPVVTDPGTLRGATVPLEWAGLANRVSAAPPSAGQIYLFDSNPRRGIPNDWPIQRPQQGWKLIARFEKPRKITALIARDLHVAKYLPAGIAAKLDPPSSYVEVYRVPAS